MLTVLLMKLTNKMIDDKAIRFRKIVSIRGILQWIISYPAMSLMSTPVEPSTTPMLETSPRITIITQMILNIFFII